MPPHSEGVDSYVENDALSRPITTPEVWNDEICAVLYLWFHTYRHGKNRWWVVSFLPTDLYLWHWQGIYNIFPFFYKNGEKIKNLILKTFCNDLFSWMFIFYINKERSSKMDKKIIEPRQDVNNQDENEYITNCRIRPDEMSIFEAAAIGHEILQKDPKYHEIMENIRNFERSDGE